MVLEVAMPRPGSADAAGALFVAGQPVGLLLTANRPGGLANSIQASLDTTVWPAPGARSFRRGISEQQIDF